MSAKLLRGGSGDKAEFGSSEPMLEGDSWRYRQNACTVVVTRRSGGVVN